MAIRHSNDEWPGIKRHWRVKREERGGDDLDAFVAKLVAGSTKLSIAS